MELRSLKYFLAIASEGSITRAAEVLHITQPALSRQLAQLEAELNKPLFIRGKRRMTLTDDGLLLQRRAKEILSLVSITESEMAAGDDFLEGSVSIGTGELASMRGLVGLISSFSERYRHVSFNLLTGVADQVSERLDCGLLDFGLFLEPVDKTGYSYVPIDTPEVWVAAMRKDDQLALKESITPADLLDRSVILPSRLGVQSDLARWFGEGFEKLDKRFTVNLGAVATEMIRQGLGVMICVEGMRSEFMESVITTRPLSPKLTGSCVLAWKCDMAQSHAVAAFAEYVQSAASALPISNKLSSLVGIGEGPVSEMDYRNHSIEKNHG